MNDFALSYLAAKDVILLDQKWAIRYWSLEEWNTQVTIIAFNLRRGTSQDWKTPYTGDIV